MKKRKSIRTNYVQQKLLSSLCCQDECFSAIANCFRHYSSYLRFEKNRSDPLMRMAHAVAAENEIETLTMPHLKMFVNDEWNAFVKFLQK